VAGGGTKKGGTGCASLTSKILIHPGKEKKKKGSWGRRGLYLRRAVFFWNGTGKKPALGKEKRTLGKEKGRKKGKKFWRTKLGRSSLKKKLFQFGWLQSARTTLRPRERVNCGGWR